VATGIVASLARPGGNVTGLSGGGAEVAGKSVELIREFSPSARRIGVIVNKLDPFGGAYLAQINQACPSLRGEGEAALNQPGQPMEPIFATFVSKRVDAVLIQAASTAKETLDLALMISRFPCGSPIAFFLRPAHVLRNASLQRSKKPWGPNPAPATMA